MLFSVGCKSPHNTAPLKDPKPYYTVGDTIPASNFTCGSPSTALPENGMTCLEGGSWTETVTCKTIPSTTNNTMFSYLNESVRIINSLNKKFNTLIKAIVGNLIKTVLY